MQKGFEGNKTQLIDREARQYAESLDHINIWILKNCIDKIFLYDDDNDTYNKDRWFRRLDYVIERAAKEGVK